MPLKTGHVQPADIHYEGHVMKKRIAHISDTHLGKREREGLRPGVWAVEMRSRLVENDFYERFSEVFDRIARLSPPVDLVVHSGDLYDSPWEHNPQAPPAVALETALVVIKDFIQRTGIPVLIIEGNHGLYRHMDVSHLDYLKLSVDGVNVATYADLRRAINEDRPLKFTYDDMDVFCFPFIERAVLESSGLLPTFTDWILTRQRPVSHGDRVSIAVAHGMDLDGSLYPQILEVGYDYVALGHDHQQHSLTNRAWYAGSPERWRFDEARQKKGFLVVQLRPGEIPEVTPQYLDFARPVINEEVQVAPTESAESVIARLREWFKLKGLRTGWNLNTAARVRLVLTGDSRLINNIDMNGALESLRTELFEDKSDYNIAQFVWAIKTKELEHDDKAFPEIISDYLIEDPDKDFQEYLQSLQLDPAYDPKIMTRIVVKALRVAIQGGDEKLSVEHLSEDDKTEG